MLVTRNSMTVRTETELGLTVLNLGCQSYFTLEDEKLARLQADLKDVASDLRTSEVLVIDLSGVEMFGSAFMRILIEQINVLKSRGIEVMLCDDQSGLLRLFGLDRLVTVIPNIKCAREIVLQRRKPLRGPTRTPQSDFVWC